MSPKILFVKLGALGDLSFALPAPAFVKKVWPTAHFTWVVGKSVASYLENRPDIDQLVVVDDKDLFSPNPIKKMKAIANWVLNLESRYDLILIAHRSPAYSLLLRTFLKGPIFQMSRQQTALSKFTGVHDVVVKPLETHESVGIGDLVSAGIRFLAEEPKEKWSGKIFAAPLLKPSALAEDLKAKEYLVLQMGGAGNLKTEFRLKSWVHWGNLLKLLLEKTNFTIVCIGAPSEANEVQAFIREALSKKKDHESRINNLVGKTSLLELEQILLGAKLVVGIDSGPLHVSDALRVPTLGIYGPSSPKSWGFLGARSKAIGFAVPCSPCYRDDGIFPECRFEHRCMVNLKAEKVFEEILSQINQA